MCVCVCVKPKLERTTGNTVCVYFNSNRKFNNQICYHMTFFLCCVSVVTPFGLSPSIINLSYGPEADSLWKTNFQNGG